MRLLSVTALGSALVVAGMVAPAAGRATGSGDDGVTVRPGVAVPGRRVELAVAGCPDGPGGRSATSRAFAAVVALRGGDEAAGTALVRRDAGTGTYRVRVRCGGNVVVGKLRVEGRPPWSAILGPAGADL